jgi:hypothetical protein
MARHWNNREVHFWWESPFFAALLLLSLACVVMFI